MHRDFLFAAVQFCAAGSVHSPEPRKAAVFSRPIEQHWDYWPNVRSRQGCTSLEMSDNQPKAIDRGGLAMNLFGSARLRASRATDDAERSVELQLEHFVTKTEAEQHLDWLESHDLELPRVFYDVKRGFLFAE